MKNKLALVIAALMITSMALSISTTSVTAGVGDSLSPTYARDDTRIKFTVTVKNDSTTDNIDNIRIIVPSGSNFIQAIGGASAAENLKLAADNMENAVAPLSQAGENLKLAGDNKEAAGQALIDAAAELVTATNKFVLLGWDNIPSLVDQAATNLDYAADNMAAASENFTNIAAKLELAWYYLNLAGGNDVDEDENLRNYNVNAAENFDNAAAWLDNVGNALLNGSLRNTGDNLVMAGSYLENAGKTGGLADNNTALGTAIQAAGSKLQLAGNNLMDAAKYENYAGINLVSVKDYLLSSGGLIRLADTDLDAAGDNLENAALQIGFAADNMENIDDNILQAGDNLSLAATYLANAATQLGAALGGDELEDAMEHENAAAENLNVETVDLGTAGQQLIDAADDLSAAATKLLATANALAPTTWTLSGGTEYVQFNAIADNVITPGSSETFVFLWTTPDIAIENTYTITITSNKEGGGAAHWIVQGTVTLTVDGAAPTLTIVVTQAGVVDKDGSAVNNLVGTALDDAKATITITASEVLQSIGTVTVENSGGTEENFVPPITLTTTDNIVYTGTFTAGAWDDNTVVVKVASAKDLVGLENTAGMENTVTVDTRAPILIDNGLAGLVSVMRTNVTQAGTGENFLYVDNKTAQSIIITVEDNFGSTDNDVWVISVTVDNTSATRSAVVENLWSLDPLTLSEGLTSVLTVTATDRTGNTASDNIENIFIDTAAPTIAFNTIAGKTWTSGIRINDNTPEIKVTVNDSGYPVSGLGIALDNLIVQLDNDDNIWNGTPYWTLENKDAWDFGLAGVFENIIDNARPEDTYYINVWASDNLWHAGENGVVSSLSFIVDVTSPSAPSLDVTVSTNIDSPTVLQTTSRTITGTAEVGATVTVYGTVDTTETVLGTDTVGSDSKWDVTITLTAGDITRIQISATDVAGNEGSRALYGYLLADATAPTVTLTALPETTDKSSITISGTINKDAWESWSDITLTVQVGVGRVTVPIGAGGSYSYSLALSEGPNTIVVQATDVIGNASVAATSTVERVVTPWAIYAIILVIVALILAAIAIFGGPILRKR